MIRNDTCKKTLVGGIIVLFICMSIVSSTGNIIKDANANYHSLESYIEPKEILSRSNIAYGYIADSGSSGLPEGPCYFYLDDPGNLYSLAPTESTYFLSGGTWSCDGIWYGCEYGTGSLWTINPNNGDMTNIGGGGTSCNGLAWDPVWNRLYGASDSDLYEYDLETGEQEFICSFGVSWYSMCIGFDGNGTLYGWFDNLWIMEACKDTLVGPLGIWAGDGHFDYDTDILYLSTYISTGQLYECDKETGNCTLIGDFEGGAEITCIAIPNDTTPPVTTHTLDPPEPDGLNGWYVSNVNVTLNATDDISGVKEIIYEVDGEQGIIKGDNGTLIITKEYDNDDLLVEYWAIDNAGNEESRNNFSIDMDQTKPQLDLFYEILGGNQFDGWDLLFTAYAEDETSGMDCVEFYKDDELQDTIIGPGPEYCWEYHWDPIFPRLRVTGFILNLEITEEYVNFFAIVVFIRALEPGRMFSISVFGYDIAGNSVYDEILQTKNPGKISPGLYLFQNLTLTNNYSGHVGRFFIRAEFEQP